MEEQKARIARLLNTIELVAPFEFRKSVTDDGANVCVEVAVNGATSELSQTIRVVDETLRERTDDEIRSDLLAMVFEAVNGMTAGRLRVDGQRYIMWAARRGWR